MEPRFLNFSSLEGFSFEIIDHVRFSLRTLSKAARGQQITFNRVVWQKFLANL